MERLAIMKTGSMAHRLVAILSSFCSLWALTVVLSSCDLGEAVYLVRPDGQPVLCTRGDETRYEAAYTVLRHPYEKQEVAYEDKYRATVKRQKDPASTNPGYVFVSLLRGSLESGRVPWVQFNLYCGDSSEPFLATRKLTVKDLEKDGNAYRYVVK